MNEEREHDLNALAAHLEGRLEGEERQRTIDHLSTCLECRETAALLARSWDAVGVQPGDRAVRRPVSVMAHRWWLGLAAAAVVGTAAAVRLLPTALPVVDPVSTQPSAPASSPAEVPRTMPPSAPPSATALDESLLPTRGGAKRIADKTFRLVRGEWIDVSFEPAAGLPVVDVTGPDERRRMLARLPGLAPYLALGDRVVVVFEGRLYRVQP